MAIYGELGTFPLSIFVKERALKFKNSVNMPIFMLILTNATM
jgi:hypothetical protein